MTSSSLLQGVRVLDLSQYIPGPFATLQMAEMGADIIKVEPPGGDPMRHFGAQPGNISAVYQHLNRGKRVIELDLKRDEGKSHFDRLLTSCDVLLEGFRPGTLDRLGYSDQTLKTLNSKLIVCHLSGFGQTGEQALRGGHDLGYSASAGLYSQFSQTQSGNGLPQIIFPPVADHAGALQALASINAALLKQFKTGLGSVLDVSLTGAVVRWQYLFKSEALCDLIGGQAAYYNLYLSRDGRLLSLGAIEPKFWQAFCDAVNKPEWVRRHAEPLPQSDLIQELTDLFVSRDQSDWQRRLADVDCCFEVVLDRKQIAQSGQSVDRAARGAVPLPELDTIQAAQAVWQN